jgi:hypothetical protein
MHDYEDMVLSGDSTSSKKMVLTLINCFNESEYSHISNKDAQEFYLEKLFREKVLQFLNKPTAKLFKSPAEGNMIVRLTNISLTPEKKLGRRIYSFSAQATEIAEYNIANLQKYGIINSVETEE